MRSSSTELLRMRAMRLVDQRISRMGPSAPSTTSINDLVHELEVHRAELEIQNESLREAEAALRLARDRYFDQFDLAPIPYVVLGEDGRIEEANLAIAALFGCERHTLMDTPLSSFIAPKDVPAFHLYRKDLVTSGVRRGMELTIWRKDGTMVPTRIESIVVKDTPQAGTKRIQGRIRMTLMDLSEIISARTEVEQGAKELGVTKAHLDSVARSMLDSLILLDGAGVIQSVNPATLALLGYEESDLVGRPFGLIMEGLGQEIFSPRDNGLGILGRSEAIYLAKDGTRITVEFSGSLVQGDHASPASAIACLAHDVTEDRRKDEQLRLTVEAAPIAMLMLDQRHHIVMLNAKCEELFSSAREELLGQPIHTLLPGEDSERHRSHREQFLEALEIKTASPSREFCVSRPDGTLIPVEVALSPFEMSDGPRVLAALADLTDRKRLEEQARHSQKMEAIGTLASGVAHDFNNLLMGIGGCADIALSTLDPASPAKMYLDEIKRSGASGAAISRQLLAFSSKRELQISVFDLNVVVSRARAMLTRTLGESIQFITRLDAKACQVRSDPSEIERILINLAINARDALPEGGDVLIETSSLALAKDNHHRLPAGDYVVLRFSDTGMGMNEEVKSRIFEPFFTTKETGRGTGLGLSVVYGIVQQAGGHIEVTSEPDQGTAFEVLFPANRQPVTNELNSPEVELLQLPRCDRTVLLLEDEPAVRMATRFYLERGGFTVLEAGTGAEAVECCINYPKPIDLLLTDVALPGMNGPSAAREVQKIKGELKVIYMSAHGPERLAHESGLTSDAHTLQKPFDSSVLLGRIHDVLNGEESLGSSSEPE